MFKLRSDLSSEIQSRCYKLVSLLTVKSSVDLLCSLRRLSLSSSSSACFMAAWNQRSVPLTLSDSRARRASAFTLLSWETQQTTDTCNKLRALIFFDISLQLNPKRYKIYFFFNEIVLIFQNTHINRIGTPLFTDCCSSVSALLFGHETHSGNPKMCDISNRFVKTENPKTSQPWLFWHSPELLRFSAPHSGRSLLTGAAVDSPTSAEPEKIKKRN